MSIYFPYSEKDKRLTAFHDSIEKLLYDPEQNDEHMWASKYFYTLFYLVLDSIWY